MQALMETSAGNITIKLYDQKAPDTVANFVRLVEGVAGCGCKPH